MSPRAPPGKPAFRCELGWHRPEPIARWNDGYYFARCRRCGRDLVRTAYGRWQVPRGFRVVWDPSRPENAVSAELVPIEDGAEGAGGSDLPIQAVLRHLHQEEQQIGHPAAGNHEATAAAEPPRGRRVGVTYIPDFMDDANTDTSWRTHRPGDGPLAAAERKATEPLGLQRPRSGLLELVLPAGGAGAEPAAAPDTRRPALAAGALVLLVVVLLLATGGREPRPAAPTGDQSAYIVASALSCVSEPYDQAPHVRWLMRGDAVGMLAREGDWASISYAGQPCWVPVRSLSLERPD